MSVEKVENLDEEPKEKEKDSENIKSVEKDEDLDEESNRKVSENITPVENNKNNYYCSSNYLN